MTDGWYPDPAGGARERRWSPSTGWTLAARPAPSSSPARSEELAKAAELYERVDRPGVDDAELVARVRGALQRLLEDAPPPTPAAPTTPTRPPTAASPSAPPNPTPLRPPPGPSPQAPPTPAPRRGLSGVPALPVLAGLALAGLLGYLGGASTVPTADERLDELAGQVCDAVAGESRLIGAGMIGLAVEQADELGFSGVQLGRRIEAECPFLYEQLVED